TAGGRKSEAEAQPHGTVMGAAAGVADDAEDARTVVEAEEELDIGPVGKGEGDLGREVVEQAVALRLPCPRFLDLGDIACIAEPDRRSESRGDDVVPAKAAVAGIEGSPDLGLVLTAETLAEADLGLEIDMAEEGRGVAGKGDADEMVVAAVIPGEGEFGRLEENVRHRVVDMGTGEDRDCAIVRAGGEQAPAGRVALTSRCRRGKQGSKDGSEDSGPQRAEGGHGLGSP